VGTDRRRVFRILRRNGAGWFGEFLVSVFVHDSDQLPTGWRLSFLPVQLF
jgi:hypothetical protein